MNISSNEKIYKNSDIREGRYARHLVLKEIGPSGQKKLCAGKVLVIGAGGLGSAALLYLASAGIGTLGIADYDTVDITNLGRQIIHTEASLGETKVASAAKAIKERNSEVEIVLHNERLTAENIAGVISDYDFVLDCVDRFEAKFLINDACVLAGKPFCHAGVMRFGGQVMTYVPKEGPCLRCLLGAEPPEGPDDDLINNPKNNSNKSSEISFDGNSKKNSGCNLKDTHTEFKDLGTAESSEVTCAEVGVLGAACGVIGSIEAIEAIKYLAGAGKLLTGRVLTFDGLNMTARTVDIPHADPNCPVCSRNI